MTNQPQTTEVFDEERLSIYFPEGLIGLAEWQSFFFITRPTGKPFHLLQAADNGRISLIVIDPKYIVADYEIRLDKADARALDNSGELNTIQSNRSHIDIYCILSVQAEPFNVTANLLGPIVINWQTGLGRQIVLSDSNYNPRHFVTGKSVAQPSVKG